MLRAVLCVGLLALLAILAQPSLCLPPAADDERVHLKVASWSTCTLGILSVRPDQIGLAQDVAGDLHGFAASKQAADLPLELPCVEYMQFAPGQFMSE